jgi:hypothetical protein
MNTTDTNDERQLWDDYASCWSAEPAVRIGALAAVTTDEIVYRDPTTEVNGRTGLAAYMTGFAGAFPGHRFRIDDVLAHHGRSLARWTQLDANGEAVTAGMSTALHQDGRLAEVTGFFLPA